MSPNEASSPSQCDVDPTAPSSRGGPSFSEDDTDDIATLLERRPLPTTSPELPPIRGPGIGAFLPKLQSWLRLHGLTIDSDTPAAFEVDEDRHQERDEGTGTRGSSLRRALLSSILVHPDHDPEYDGHGNEDPVSLTVAGSDECVGHPTRYVCGLRKDIFQNLMDSARQTLEDATALNARKTSPSSTEKLDPGAAPITTYVLKDDDLRCLIARVVRILEALHHASLLSLDEQERRNRAASRESISVAKAILPQTPKEADTATTITLPETYITPMSPTEPTDAWLSHPAMNEDIRTAAILIPQSTVTSKTEINWITSNRIASVPGVSNSLSAPQVSSGSRSRSVGHHSAAVEAGGGSRGDRNLRASVGSIALVQHDKHPNRRPSTAETTARAHVDTYPSAVRSVGSSQGSIISFPALRVRHCTNDWLTPPASTPGAMGHGDANLYKVGIDAHTGPDSFFVPQSATDKPLATPAVTTTDMAFTFTTTEFTKGADTRKMSHDHAHKLGTSIGTSAGKKRQLTPPDADAGSSSVLQKLRRGSAQIGQAISSVVGGSTLSQEPQQSAHGRRTSCVDQMKAILDRASVQHDRTETADHLLVNVAGDRHTCRPSDTCSEDGRPHVCSDEIMSWSGSQALSFRSGL
ncbi:hypothetical protein GE09DRAFT_1278170 [Coniochaeta sp. 2T2.1]|nr:hypothetical protein GE09DRAFT_1278170 [Coniochaeta sp. 2T2.1]